MKLHPIVLACFLAGAWFASPAQTASSDMNNPIVRAVIKSYEEQLREDPTNYRAYFGRGNEYYQHNDYVRALDDFTKALEYAPARDDEEGTRSQTLLLRADIYNQMHQPEKALADLTAAAELSPESYVVTYQKANTEYVLGLYKDAQTDYKRLQRLNPRSVEALIGLARVAVKENNLGTANELLANAVTLDPNCAETFVRRASVRSLMGDHNGAVDDLIIAISTNDPKGSNALQELVNYGNTNYAATMAGLSNAISAAPNQPIFPYLRAQIAQSHYHFLAALTDYRDIIDRGLYNYHGIYASMAQCEYALGNYESALGYIDTATGMSRNEADYFATRALILLALGRAEGAIAATDAGLLVNPSSTAVLEARAQAFIALGKGAEASAALGEVLMNDSGAPAPLLLRAWVTKTMLKNDRVSAQMLEHLLDNGEIDQDNPRSLRGFALWQLDRKEQAEKWMEEVLKKPDNDGYNHYLGACFYSMTDDRDKALECVDKALERGFGDYELWSHGGQGWLTVAPLRDELRFLNLLSRHAVLWGK